MGKHDVPMKEYMVYCPVCEKSYGIESTTLLEGLQCVFCDTDKPVEVKPIGKD